MEFLPVLDCKGCSRTIWLPPPTQSDTFPNQSPWRWGNRSLNVACLSCNQAFEYLAEDCRWDQPPTDQTETTRNLVTHQFSARCDEKLCQSRLHILAIKTEQSRHRTDVDLLATISAQGILCDTGHANFGRLNGGVGGFADFGNLPDF